MAGDTIGYLEFVARNEPARLSAGAMERSSRCWWPSGGPTWSAASC